MAPRAAVSGGGMERPWGKTPTRSNRRSQRRTLFLIVPLQHLVGEGGKAITPGQGMNGSGRPLSNRAAAP